MQNHTRSETSARTSEVAGKYLTFALGNEEYGVEILKVREIIGLMPITAVPRVPDYVKGVVNLRGKVIPVIDLRLKFAMDEAQHTEQTCIIVVDVGEVEIGVIVDRVSEVVDIPADDIESGDSFGSLHADFILGLGKTGGTVTILLDITRVLQGEDQVAEAVAAPAPAVAE